MLFSRVIATGAPAFFKQGINRQSKTASISKYRSCIQQTVTSYLPGATGCLSRDFRLEMDKALKGPQALRNSGITQAPHTKVKRREQEGNSFLLFTLGLSVTHVS